MQRDSLPVDRAPEWRIERSSSRKREVSSLAPGEWFARPDSRSLLRSLPDVRTVQIEVNGCLAGAEECLAEATRELAIGWAFMHRFYSAADHIRSVSASPRRVAIMVHSGEDVERRKLQAVGWKQRDDDAESTALSTRAPRAVPFVSQHEVVALSERAFARFEVDGRASGLACAALAGDDDLIVIARDIAARGAVAKILGWMLTEGTGQLGQSGLILIVSGLIDDVTVQAAGRAGVGVVISDAEPTAAAARQAAAQGTTVLGLVMSHSRAFFADGGHVGDDSDQHIEPDRTDHDASGGDLETSGTP